MAWGIFVATFSVFGTFALMLANLNVSTQTQPARVAFVSNPSQGQRDKKAA